MLLASISGPISRWLLPLVAIAALLVVGSALAGAVGAYERPVASILVDPDARVSGIGLPSWEGLRLGLHFPDRFTDVDGVALAAKGDRYAGRTFDEAVSAAYAEGRRSIRARLETASGVREVELPIVLLDPAVWWILAAAMFFVGGLYVLAALTAIHASPDGPLARTFAKTALLCATFMMTFFDAHTTRWLVPLAVASFGMLPGAFCELALRLPDDARVLRRHPWIASALDVAGFALAGAMVTLIAMHRPTGDVRSICSLLLAVSQMFFVGTFVVRYVRSKGERRTIMRALLLAIAPPHALVGVAVVLAVFSRRGSAATFLVSIPVLSLLPISAVMAFMRHNLWGSRELVSRVVTQTGAGALAFVAASGLGAAFVVRFGVPISQALLASTSGALAAAALVTLMLRVSDRRFFRARSEYRPAIERLSEHLKSLTDPEAVVAAVERVVRSSLSCDSARLVLIDGEPTTSTPPLDHALSAQLVLGGRALGSIEAYKTRRSDALFTSEDVILLRTIANQAALAVAYTRSYQELEERRRRQAEAWRGEREVLLETVAAEVAHEIRYPINFFRSMFGRESARRDLVAEEIEIGREEVERLERLVSGLRRLEHRRLTRAATSLADLVARAELLLRDLLGDRTLSVGPLDGVALRADVDQVTQILVNLLSNALDAVDAVADGGGRVGVLWRAEKSGGSLVVWDSGPGFPGDPAELFTPWFTTKPRGTGLGLAITHRIVRAHGWSIDARRVGLRTEFCISIPSEDVLQRT